MTFFPSLSGLLAQVDTGSPAYQQGQIGGGLFLFIVYALALFICAQKLNVESPILAFIPFVNLWYMTKVAGLDWWYTILLFVPCLNVFVILYVWWRIAERRGKPGFISVLLLLPCLNLLGLYLIAQD